MAGAHSAVGPLEEAWGVGAGAGEGAGTATGVGSQATLLGSAPTAEEEVTGGAVAAMEEAAMEAGAAVGTAEAATGVRSVVEMGLVGVGATAEGTLVEGEAGMGMEAMDKAGTGEEAMGGGDTKATLGLQGFEIRALERAAGVPVFCDKAEGPRGFELVLCRSPVDMHTW